MLTWFYDLDRILRGEATRLPALRRGTVEVPVAGMLAVLSSLGPIFAFFSVSTTSYSFMILVNVVVFAVSGLLGLVFLLQTLHRLSVAPREPVPRTEAAELVGEAKGGPAAAAVGPL